MSGLFPPREVMAVWDSLRHFSPDELAPGGHKRAFPQPERMHPDLLLILDELRHDIGHPIGVNVSLGSGSSSASQHRLGRAVDIVCPSIPLALFFAEVARRPWITGVGIYPHWRTPGLHIDNRVLDHGEPRAMWWRREWTRNKQRHEAYHNLDEPKRGPEGLRRMLAA